MHETHGGALVEGKTHFIARGVCIDFVLFCFVFHDLRDLPFFLYLKSDAQRVRDPTPILF